MKFIKSKEHLRHIPTIIPITSSNQKDLVECYRIGMAGYVLKVTFENTLTEITKYLKTI